MSNFQALLSPFEIGGLTLKNRVVMTSLTRNRNNVQSQINVDHYSQRASFGLILTEGTLIEPQGTEWIETPGIWSKVKIKAWKEVTDGVHNNGCVANTLHNVDVLPSAIKGAGGKCRLLVSYPGHSVPKAIDDPKYYVNLFKFGKDRVGISLPFENGINEMGEETEQDMYGLYSLCIRELDARKTRGLNFKVSKFTALIKHTKIFLNGNFTAKEVNKAIEEGKADAVAFNRSFISNSDTIERFEKTAHLNPITYSASLYLYEGDYKHVEYNNYPVLA